MSSFGLNADVEMLTYGIVFFVLAMPIAPLFALIMMTIHKRDCRKPNLTYKLMNLINFFQLGQGVGHFVTSPALIFPALLEKWDVFIRIIGCVMNTFWIADLPVMTLLAVSRILIFHRIIPSNTFPVLIRIPLFLALVWIAFVLVYGCFAQNLKFTPPWWGYDFEVPHTDLFAFLELALSFPCLAVSYLAYLVVIYLIYVMKKKKSNVQSRRNEVAILLQYTFVTIYITILIVVWHPALFSAFNFIDMENTKNQAILNLLWIVYCYVNPLMMLLFNKTIRRDCINVMRIQSKKSRRVVVSIVSSH